MNVRQTRPNQSVQEEDHIAGQEEENEDEYGSDLDTVIIDDILSKLESQPLQEVVLTSIEQDPVTEYAIVHLRSSQDPKTDTISIQAGIELNPTTASRLATTKETSPSQTEESTEIVNDDRSPLQRFRTHPKKPLSVTDIISPAWCEQQYLFSLSKHGRVRRTPAMKQGSKIHKVLEEQVHTTVRIEVKTREDMFGLKLWNVIQGMRTLSSTGLTRELEVWGILDGEVVNGVIDGITTECPDEAFETRMLGKDCESSTKKPVKLEANQTTLTSFISTPQPVEEIEKTYYLVDVKTRQSRTLPNTEGQLRPTQMQLMLYRRLLASLASDEVDKEIIFERYGLNGKLVFSDVFIAEIAKLELGSSSSSDTSSAGTLQYEDSISELLAHNTLDTLWIHMIGVLVTTMKSKELSPMLAAEFRAAVDGKLLGKKSFAFDAEKLDAYVQDELQWWKGERATKGVEIEEAFKCRMCEFADDCSWRKNKVEESIQRIRQQRNTVQM